LKLPFALPPLNRRTVGYALFMAGLVWFYARFVVPPMFELIDRGQFLSKFQVTPAMSRQVVEALAREMETRYIFAEGGAKAAARIRFDLATGKYDPIRETRALTDTLIEDIRGDNDGDRNLSVVFTVNPIEQPAGGGTLVDPRAPWDAQAEGTELDTLGRPTRTDGVGMVRTLDGNVGYLQILHFNGGADAARHFAQAMQDLHGTRELVLDLRDNSGGEVGSAVALASFFFSEARHLASVQWRRGPGELETERLITTPPSGETAYFKQPVIVLVSRQSVSAAELLAWALQRQGRAKVLGESTRGASHPAVRVRLSEHFGATIPVGRVFEPKTGQNWERSGVIPDRYLLAYEALEVVKRELKYKGEIGIVNQP